jgi:LPXTG-motif cell wall-anchored protein
LWPDPNRASSFWLVLGAMGAVSAGLGYYFYRRRWL